ncbi:MAG TPA: NADH-quinone oxidoreductase subunit M [Thermoanaerobaculia bacterium]|nr:NADH-quinone oxidoreductase subunit M [Thermoanaerobaculia bacterium]
MSALLKSHVLTVLVFLPTVAAALVLLFPERRAREARIFALGASVVELALSLPLWWRFDLASDGFQFTEKADWIPALGISYTLGIDGISLLLILLTTVLTPVSLLYSLSLIDRGARAFSIAFLVLETGVIGTLVALDLALFYVFWEVMLVPMYFIIGIWGGARRIYAAMKFFLFTMAGSLLMFLAILYLAIRHRAVTGGWSFLLADLARLTYPTMAIQTVLFIAFALAFAIKVPLFPLHTWLPDAHTEAPTAGSIILAGILLKLGVYGYLRFALPLFPDAALRYAPWLGVLGLIGVVYGAFVAYTQKDMKRLVAYSSVSHLGLVVVGIGAFTSAAVTGSVLQMINHGLSTGALFLLVGVLYERSHTRQIADYGGIAGVAPVTTALFLVATFSSIGLPGLNGFVGEFLILLGTWTSVHRWWAIAAATGIILSAVYMLTLVQRVFWNPLTREENRKLPDVRPSELVAAATLVVLMVWIGIRPNDFLDRIRPSVEQVRRSAAARKVAEGPPPEARRSAGNRP